MTPTATRRAAGLVLCPAPDCTGPRVFENTPLRAVKPGSPARWRTWTHARCGIDYPLVARENRGLHRGTRLHQPCGRPGDYGLQLSCRGGVNPASLPECWGSSARSHFFAVNVRVNPQPLARMDPAKTIGTSSTSCPSRHSAAWGFGVQFAASSQDSTMSQFGSSSSPMRALANRSRMVRRTPSR
jgi:hypothetical protein